MALSLALNQNGSVPRQTGMISATRPTSAINRTGAAPSAAANFNLQGKDYFNNLVQNGTPTEKQAGQLGLANPKVGTHPGMLPSTPVKKITAVDGTQTEFHAPAPTTAELQANTQKNNSANYGTPPAPTTPQVGTPTNNAQNVLNAGNQTSNEQSTQQGLLQSGQMTPWETAAANNVITAKGIQNFGQFAPYAEASMHAGDNAGQLGNLITAPDLAGRSAADSALYNQFSNLYGTQANAGLIAAQTAAGRNLTANQNAYSGSQNQANRGLTGAENVLSASLPTQSSPTNVPFSPLTGNYGMPASNAYGTGGLAGVGGLLQQQQQGADVQTMSSALNQTSGLINKAKSDIKTAGFNPSPVALGNYLTQWLNGQAIPDHQYANVVNDLSEIANTIAPVLGTPGNPTDLKTTIAQELIPRLMAGQDIGTVLDNLEQNANIKISKARDTATGTPLSTSSTSGSTGEGFATSW